MRQSDRFIIKFMIKQMALAVTIYDYYINAVYWNYQLVVLQNACNSKRVYMARASGAHCMQHWSCKLKAVIACYCQAICPMSIMYSRFYRTSSLLACLHDSRRLELLCLLDLLRAYQIHSLALVSWVVSIAGHNLFYISFAGLH